MNWTDATTAMRAGHAVVRQSQQRRELVGAAPNGLPIYDCGTESMRLAAAWTDENQPVRVYQGTGSKALFVPDDDDMRATDWVIE